MADRRPLALVTSVAAAVLVTAVPARAQDVAVEGLVVGIERETVAIERSVIVFDGQVAEAEGTEITVTLDAEVLFDFDQATLTDQAQATLRALAEELAETLTVPEITVVGHTDALGTDEHNRDLSQRRAAAVSDFLAPLVTVPAQFVVEGRGSAEPVAPNTTPDGSDDPEGRRRNRRVEVTYTAAGD